MSDCTKTPAAPTLHSYGPQRCAWFTQEFDDDHCVDAFVVRDRCGRVMLVNVGSWGRAAGWVWSTYHGDDLASEDATDEAAARAAIARYLTERPERAKGGPTAGGEA